MRQPTLVATALLLSTACAREPAIDTNRIGLSFRDLQVVDGAMLAVAGYREGPGGPPAGLAFVELVLDEHDVPRPSIRGLTGPNGPAESETVFAWRDGWVQLHTHQLDSQSELRHLNLDGELLDLVETYDSASVHAQASGDGTFVVSEYGGTSTSVRVYGGDSGTPNVLIEIEQACIAHAMIDGRAYCVPESNPTTVEVYGPEGKIATTDLGSGASALHPARAGLLAVTTAGWMILDVGGAPAVVGPTLAAPGRIIGALADDRFLVGDGGAIILAEVRLDPEPTVVALATGTPNRSPSVGIEVSESRLLVADGQRGVEVLDVDLDGGRITSVGHFARYWQPAQGAFDRPSLVEDTSAP